MATKVDLLKEFGIRVIRGSQVSLYFKTSFYSDSRWGWVAVNDLAKAMKMEPVDMLRKFQPLSRFIFPGYDTVTMFEAFDANGNHSQNGIHLEEVELMPAGLANTILRVYQAGVRSLEVREIPNGTDDDEILGTYSWNYIPPQYGYPAYNVLGLDEYGNNIVNNILD